MKLTRPLIPAEEYNAPEIGEVRNPAPGVIVMCEGYCEEEGAWIGRVLRSIFTKRMMDGEKTVGITRKFYTSLGKNVPDGHWIPFQDNRY